MREERRLRFYSDEDIELFCDDYNYTSHAVEKLILTKNTS